MSYEGGYITHRADLVRQSSANKHTSELVRPVSDFDLRAVNNIQATPWRINRFILDTLSEAQAHDIPLPGVRETFSVDVPPMIPEDEWTALDPEDREARRRARSLAKAANDSAEGHLVSLLDVLSIGQRLASQPAIYYPHSKCFRGRVHPIPMSGPHPQGSDAAKACLMFASGLPLGSDGMFWLCVRAANCVGMGKRTFEDRVQWVIDHKADIEASARYPFSCRWWADVAEEPWSFLATCYELEQAWATGDDYGETFVSHLPVNLDGTCNGLQHLSAIGRDPAGAMATNLIPCDAPQDIYQIVAEAVGRRVGADAMLFEAPIAGVWLGHISRATVKRAVMTTPYGVTPGGIRRQLMTDGHLPPGLSKQDAREAAAYMAKQIVASLGTTVQAASGIMEWLQGTARALAESGHPFRWVTPSGSVVQQAYKAVKLRRISTLAGTLTLAQDIPGAALDPRKQALGASPNFIHSFDAAHLSLTVNACHDAGMRSFAMIHDSYATHAANATEMGMILRREFMRMYRGLDWLSDTAMAIRAYAPGVVLPPVPKQGDLDLDQVLDSQYFFS